MISDQKENHLYILQYQILKSDQNTLKLFFVEQIWEEEINNIRNKIYLNFLR